MKEKCKQIVNKRKIRESNMQYVLIFVQQTNKLLTIKDEMT